LPAFPGSAPIAPSPSERIAFWTRLHERLARLANRLDAETQGTILPPSMPASQCPMDGGYTVNGPGY
jgi:hypothetical protein